MAKKYGEIGASAKMTFDKSFTRANGQPLDSTEVFYSKAAAEAYAATDVAYIGQKIVVIETVDGVEVATHYSIEPDGTLKEFGGGSVDASIATDEEVDAALDAIFNDESN